MPDISSRTFRTVRKGFDPDEVRRYLLEVQALVDALEVGPPPGSAQQADAHAEQVVQAARAQADSIMAEANRLLAEAREQQALQPWQAPDTAPGAVEAVKQADEIIAAAKAQAEAIVKEAEDQASGIDRWDGLGEHVARIVAQAEEESKAIVAEARTEAEAIIADAELQRFQLTSAASADRTEASATLERARNQATDLVRGAEREAAELRDTAEPRAREHIDGVLAAARGDLDRLRQDLQATLDQLEVVHGLVGRSLANRPTLPEFYAAERFLSTPPATADPSPASISYDSPTVEPIDVPDPVGEPAAGSESPSFSVDPADEPSSTGGEVIAFPPVGPVAKVGDGPDADADRPDADRAGEGDAPAGGASSTERAPVGSIPAVDIPAWPEPPLESGWNPRLTWPEEPRSRAKDVDASGDARQVPASGDWPFSPGETPGPPTTW